MEERILLALENIDELNYSDKIINSFSYEDRLNFFNKFSLIKNSEIYNKLKYILTSDEIVKIIDIRYKNENVNAMIDSNNKKYFISLFNSLDIDNKVKEFLKLDKSLMIYTCNYVFNTDELKSKFIDKLDLKEYDRYERVINSIINGIENFEIKLKNIDKISYFSPLLVNLIPLLNKDEIEYVFNNLNLNELTKAYLILRCIDFNVSKEYFLKLKDEYSKSVAFKRFSKNYIKNINELYDNDGKKLDDIFSLEDIKKLFLNIKDEYKVLSLKEFEDEDKLLFIPFIDEENKVKLLSIISNYKIMFEGLNYLNNVSDISKILCFYKGEFPKYHIIYNRIIKEYSKIYGVNYDHLIELSKIVSLEILNNLSIPNIRSIINMDDNDFYKFISFFNQNNTKLNNYSLNNIFEAFANKIFNINFHYIRHYFNDVLKFSRNGNADKAKEILNKIFSDLDDSTLKGYNIHTMYELLASGDKKAINDFHNICNLYIEKTRNFGIKTSVDIYINECLNTTYEVSSAIKEIISYGTSMWIYDNYLSKILYLFSPREIELLNNKELFNQIYEFKLNPTNNAPSIIKTNIFVFNKIMDKFYSEYKNDKEILEILNNSSVKKVPLIPDVDTTYLINIMSHFNVNDLKEKLLDNDSLCIGLNNLLKKYNLLAFNSAFRKIEMEADTDCDHETVSSIFLNYSDIIKNFKKANMQPTMTSILDLGMTYNPNFEIYKNVFEDENFKFITLNPPENRAESLKIERREASLKNYINCYRRNKVSVPAFDEDINVYNNPINVVVGNFTNPINLTYGERTGSCMRSGGIGDDLYNFCINNDKAFHIRFTNSKTGEFISKISGFRNGNTVFLNQLKRSVIDGYDEKKLLEACKLTASMLIEISKDSEYPIDNVLISYDEKKMDIKDINLVNINIPKTSIMDGDEFWFDLEPKECVLLASSKKDNSLVPVKLGKFNYYPVQRDKIRLAQDSNDGVKHIEALEQLLSGKRIEDIKFENKEYEVCYYGEDWYVAIDKDGNIFKKIMNKSKDFETAFNEMNTVLENLKNVNDIFEKEEDKVSKK